VTADELLLRLHTVGVTLNVRGDKLRYAGPKAALTPELLDELRRHKPELLSAIHEIDALINRLVERNPANWPTDEVNLARAVGRGDLHRALRCLRLLVAEHEGRA
jgi:hypothetical protein